MKSVTVTVRTKEQYIICFFYSDSIKQDCIDFIRELSRFHDNSMDYRICVEMYEDNNTLYDISEFLTGDILTVITIVSRYIEQFLRG